MSSLKYPADEENEVVIAGNFSQNDEVIEVLDSDEEKEFHSDAESKSEGEEIGKFVDLSNHKTISQVF